MAENTLSQIAQQNLGDLLSIIENIKFQRSPERFVQFLTQGDFFYAPASRVNHDNCDGGLYNHSKRVFNSMKILNKILKNRYSDQSLFYMSFGHDICKINYYKPKQMWYKDENNRWLSKPGWVIQDNFPVGHGQKSIILMLKYVQLTEQQMLAIRWHMGAFDKYTSDQVGKILYGSAQQMTPLTRMLHIADLMSITLYN